ncbi:cupin domain-containing protein [Pacificispira sp.]|uniref:cupin domain-containing protein n=1 Tax=Pacificispira sp. TaxID=2888761 RepID=UPI003B52D0CE
MRRFVTGTGTDGKSRIFNDLPEPGLIKVEGREGFAIHNMWQTVEAKPFVGVDQDMARPKGLLPPENGTILRIVDFPPDIKDPEERRKVFERQFKEQFGDVAHNTEDGVDVGMHQHPTIDYAIVIKGSIVLVLDNGEQLLEEGDIVIQRGANHRWQNETNEICRIAFVQVDGRDQP